MPGYDYKIGEPCKVTLWAKDKKYLESTQGICCGIARNLPGDRAGEAAAIAESNLGLLRELLTAPPPVKLESK
jgi:hypothetical protein